VAANCPVEGYPKSRGDRQLMCKRHWYMVPKELRDRVWETARRMWADDEDGLEDWIEAKDAAIAVVEMREGEL
jgi:hypothetical protein